jgi:hypothetical protein
VARKWVPCLSLPFSAVTNYHRPTAGRRIHVEDVLDLWILDSGRKSNALACARTTLDLAVADLPFGREVKHLTAFRGRIDRALRGREDSPTPDEFTDFGHRLFRFCIRDDIKALYDKLPADVVRIRLFSNRPELQALPWEYLQEPGKVPGPRLDRSVVRVVQTGGTPPPDPLRFTRKMRVLFVAADPVGQTGVSWAESAATVERKLTLRLGDSFDLRLIESATEDGLTQALQQYPCDILHFAGHGDVSANGEGRLILVHPKTQASAHVSSRKLALLLRGRGIRLVVLSACDTASGRFEDDFAVVASTLVREGVTAVVAHQLPFPNDTMAAFVGALYKALLQFGDIDRAIVEGRITLAGLSAEPRPPLEWGVPTLYRHIAGAQLLALS